MIIEKKELDALIEASLEDTIQIRRKIHQNPELGGCETETAELIKRELEKLNIPYVEKINGYGICAVIEGKDKEHSIGVRADIDALPMEELTDVPFKSKKPGIMHACGHDVHTSSLLGTAKVLSQLRDKLPMSVTLLFEPQEETDGGADGMVKAGCLDKPKAKSVIGFHINPSYDFNKVVFFPGVMNAATCGFDVRVIGKSCHGAHPDLGIDPLLPACTMVTSLQSVITRRIHPADAALVTVGKFNSGTGANMIPDETTFSGTIRVLDMSLRDVIKAELRKVFEGTAHAYGATCQIEFDDGYPTLVNDDNILKILSEKMAEVHGKENIVISPKASLGADDFAYFCHKVPSLYFDIGSKSPEDEPGPLHSSKLKVDERCIKTAISTEVYSVLELMEVEI